MKAPEFFRISFLSVCKGKKSIKGRASQWVFSREKSGEKHTTFITSGGVVELIISTYFEPTPL
jgi:hypothetical protein